MNIRDFKYVEAVASHRNFSRAANACNVSQPALSSQIKKLEKEFGVALFERRANEVLLTEFGARAVESARKILQQAEVIRTIALEYRDPESLPLKIGLPPTLAPYLAEYFREMLFNLYPNMRIVLFENTPIELAQMVDSKEIDVALVARKSHESIYCSDNKKPLRFSSIWSEALYLGVREGHPIAQRKTISAGQVPAALLVRYSSTLGFELEKDLPNLPPDLAERVSFDVSAARYETVCRHVSRSDKCTIVNAIAAEQFKQDNWGLKFIKFEDEGNIRDIGFISRSGCPRSTILKKICDSVRNNPPKGVIAAVKNQPCTTE